MKILYIGFKPFASHSINPSELLVNELIKKGHNGIILDVSYQKAKDEFEEAYEKTRPDFVVISALSPFTSHITLEQYAYNEMDSTQLDNDGVIKTHEAIDESLPKSVSTTLDPFCIEQYLASVGITSRVAIDPGRFVCNEIYFLSLNKNNKTLLVHLPLNETRPVNENLEAFDYIDKYLQGMN